MADGWQKQEEIKPAVNYFLPLMAECRQQFILPLYLQSMLLKINVHGFLINLSTPKLRFFMESSYIYFLSLVSQRLSIIVQTVRK